MTRIKFGGDDPRDFSDTLDNFILINSIQVFVYMYDGIGNTHDVSPCTGATPGLFHDL